MITTNLKRPLATFGLSLLKNLEQMSPGKNVTFSPVSIFLVLLMAYAGADSETESAIRKTLDLETAGLTDKQTAIEAVLTSLNQSDNGIEAALATAVWTHPKVTIRADYKKTLEETFKTAISQLDEDAKIAKTRINQWVNYHTQQKITSIVDSIQSNDRLLLINAIYFNGQWQDPFDPDLTTMQPFTERDGNTRLHPMMQKKGIFYYDHYQGIQVISLPYTANFRMLILLPQETQSVSKLIESLTPLHWNDLIEGLEYQEIDLSLPRFAVDGSQELGEVLKCMGMGIAFSTTADFSKMTYEELKISKVIHKATTKVNEVGSESAAATAATLRSKSGYSKPPTMVVNRPFIYAIENTSSKSLVFLGVVNNPKDPGCPSSL